MRLLDASAFSSPEMLFSYGPTAAVGSTETRMNLASSLTASSDTKL
jgi:hypothetical protein